MKRTKGNPLGVLIASAGVASVNYAVAAGCNDGGGTVTNLVLCPPSQCPPGGVGGASVANLVAWMGTEPYLELAARSMNENVLGPLRERDIPVSRLPNGAR